MCVLALAWKAHPRWKLVLVGNRDERHDRPAAPLARWAEAPEVLGGIDLVSRGSWLGVSEAGRFAVVTNLRGAGVLDPQAPSRGRLVGDVLTGQGRYADPHAVDLSPFNPLNLIVVRGDVTVFLTNRPQTSEQQLGPGLFGMSNGGLEDGWPKTDRLKGFLAGWLAAGDAAPAALLDGLGDEGRPRDEQLPATGLGLERERLASAIFIRNEVYGTRCSSVVAIDADGRGVFLERRFDEAGVATGETSLDFRWP